MNGDDLITLAGNLVANQALGNSEARYRSSVSRAYYGAFHWALYVLGQCGETVVQNSNAHSTAHRALNDTGVPIAIEASRSLRDLHGDRIEADYRFHKPRFSKQKNARVCVESAVDTVKDLKQCLEEPARTQIQLHFQSKRANH